MATMALLNLCYGESCKSVCTQVIHRNFSDSSEQFWAGLVCIVHVAAKTDNVWFICFKFHLIFIYVRLIFIYARYTMVLYMLRIFWIYVTKNTYHMTKNMEKISYGDVFVVFWMKKVQRNSESKWIQIFDMNCANSNLIERGESLVL